MRSRLLLTLVLAPVATAAAQVGYLPSQSPYRELTRGAYFEPTVGRMFGTGGLLELGPRNGTSVGLRYVLRARNTLQFSFGLWSAGLQRTWIDADDSVATRNKGLVNQRVSAAEFGVQLNLTGGKTWHGLAPFGGVNLGIARGSASPPADTSGYAFGTKLVFGPSIGTRFFVGQRLYLKVEARGVFWKLEYPASYNDEPAKQPGTATHSNAVNTTGVTSQYTVTPELRIGLGIAWW